MIKSCTAEVEIVNKLGLHVRPAALFVEEASQFNSHLTVCIQGDEDHIVNGKSILGIMMLVAQKGSILKLSATGEDAEEMITKLISVIKKKFGDIE